MATKTPKTEAATIDQERAALEAAEQLEMQARQDEVAAQQRAAEQEAERIAAEQAAAQQRAAEDAAAAQAAQEQAAAQEAARLAAEERQAAEQAAAGAAAAEHAALNGPKPYEVISPLQQDAELRQIGDIVHLTEAQAAPLLGHTVRLAAAAA